MCSKGARRNETGGLWLINRLALALVASLALAASALASDAHKQVHCGRNLACIVKVAHLSCKTRHDAWHCRLWRRHDPVAHAARVHVLIDTTCGTEACDEAYLVQLVGPAEAACGEAIIGGDSTGWVGEDNTWDPEIVNPSSGAYGLPQSIGSMDSAGADWRDDPDTQERWMVSYADARYGDLCGALEHEHEHGWY